MGFYKKIKFKFNLLFNSKKSFNNKGEIHIGDFVVKFNVISTFSNEDLRNHISKNLTFEKITGYTSEILENIEELWKIKIEVDCLGSGDLIYFDEFKILSFGEHIKNNRDFLIDKIFKQ